MAVDLSEPTPSLRGNAIADDQPGLAHWRFWGTLVWGIVIAIMFFASQAIGALIVVAFRYGFDLKRLHEWVKDGDVLAASAIGGAVGCIGAIVCAIRLKKGAAIAEYLRLKRIKLRIFFKWLGIFVIFLIASDLLDYYFPHPADSDFMVDAYKTADPLWVLWFAVIVAAPLSEEILFRGFLFRGFETSFLGPIGAIIVTASAWALLHLQYDAYAMGIIFALGLLFGAARRDSDSLLLPLTFHILQNLLATASTAILR